MARPSRGSCVAPSGDPAIWEQVVHRSCPGGTPRLDAALAALDCDLGQRVPGGAPVIGLLTAEEIAIPTSVLDVS